MHDLGLGQASTRNEVSRTFVQVNSDSRSLAAGESLKDPAGYVKRLNALLLELSA